MQASTDIQNLLAIMELLRSPDGCPWDKQQDYASLVPYTLEEAYEVAEAIKSGQENKICDELGDLLLQIVFISQVAAEQGHFDFGDVVNAISSKLIRRHPHIFSTKEAQTAEDVAKIWQQVKADESNANKPDIPPLPGLLLLHKWSSRISSGQVEDPLLRKLVEIVQQAKAENRCLEAEVRQLFSKVAIAGRNSQGHGE